MATKQKALRTTPFTSGPFVGVYATREPYDARPEYAVDAVNCYVANPASPSEYVGRPPFRRLNGGDPVYAPGIPFRGQLVYSHTNLDGTTVNFVVIGGHLFRADATLATFTDVTPVGVAISGAIQVRVFGVSLIGTLAFTDGVNRMWIATNLTSTPITGTYIDYDGHGVSWATFGAPKVYNGSAFVILSQVNGVSRRVDISWCNVGDFSTGWQQDDFDNNWTLSQNEAGLLFALESDNTALRYFRELSIGAASGSSVLDLASTATDDALAFNIGTQSPQCVQKFGNGFFFIDAQGRPYWYTPGIAPDPIWKQMRTWVEAGTTNFPSTTAIVSTAVVEPTLNLYLVAIWSPSPGTQSAPLQIHVFDAITRIYQGRWIIGEPVNGVEALGVLYDAAGRATIVALTTGGFAWGFNAFISATELLATESGVTLSTEDGVDLTTEGEGQVWTDDGFITQYVQADRLGYAEDVNLNVDSATVITLSQSALQVSLKTSAQITRAQGTPVTNNSDDQTFRTFVGCDMFGRGPQVTVEPLEWNEQFALTRVSIKAALSNASPEDQ